MRSRLKRRMLVCVLTAAWLGALGATDAAALPPGWGYELVSPSNTDGLDVFLATGSVDGDHTWVQTTSSREQTTGNLTTLEAVRARDGWVRRDLSDASQPGDDSYTLQGTAVDGSSVVLLRCARILLGCVGDERFERVTADGGRSTILTVPRIGIAAPEPRVVGASRDTSRIVVQNPAGEPPLVSADTHSSGQGLYRASASAAPEFLGYNESGNVLPCGAVLANGLVGVGIGTGFEQNGLSADAQTVVFTSPDPDSGCPDPPDLYVREGQQTFVVSRPDSSSRPDLGARYVGSSEDGRTIYFSSASQIHASDVDAAVDLYAYDVSSHLSTALTEGAGIENAVVAPNGAYVYFTADNPIDGRGNGGDLWSYHDGVFAHIVDADPGAIALGAPTGDSVTSPVTPDGRHLLFASLQPLTGVASNGSYQLYQYSTVDGSLVCVSCHSDGSPTISSASLPSPSPDTLVTQRRQSDDGSTVIFQTQEPLLPQDTNGNVVDVYLWHQGTLSLITSGRSQSNFSPFASLDAAGHTVTFVSNDRLTFDADQDNLKVYVARLGGGFPAPTVSRACEGDACQPLPTPAPAPAIPTGSSTLPPRQHSRAPARRPRLRITGHLASGSNLKLTIRTSRQPVAVTITARRHGRMLAHTTKTLRQRVTHLVLRIPHGGHVTVITTTHTKPAHTTTMRI